MADGVTPGWVGGEWRDPNDDPSYRTLLETIQHGLVVITADGRVVYANRAMGQLLGEDAIALTGRQLEDFYHPDERDVALATRAVRRRGGDAPRRFDRRFLRTDGLVVETLGSATALFAEGELAGFLTEYTDVTAQRLRDRVLAATLNEETAILETAPTPIILIDERGAIQRVNRATTRVFGWSEEELIGQDVGLLASDEDAVRHGGYLRHFIATGEASTPEGLVVDRTREVRARRRDGTEFPADLTVGVVPRSAHGPRQFVGVIQDVTERREAEQQLLVAQKTESLARLIAGVAHDFNNLLMVIGGSIELAQGHSAEADGWLRSAEGAVGRASSLVRQLLQYSRQQTRHGAPVDVVTLIRSTMDLVEQMVDRRISMRLEVSGEVPQAPGDRSQLEQVVMNLLVNACDAVGDLLDSEERTSGYVEATVGRDWLDGRPAVRFTVADNGPGIPGDIIERVFDPFFTTKADGRGTGLGLSTSYGIIRSHRGQVAVESVAGEGATFTVVLPASRVTEDVGDPAGGEPATRGAGRTVLLVESDVELRRAQRSTLRGVGYGVLEAADGAEALAFPAGSVVDVAVVGMARPNGAGWGPFRALAGALEGTPIVIVSESVSEAEAVHHGAVGVLGRPYRDSHLLAAVFSALKASPATGEASGASGARPA